ncbi:hypothetical protein O0S10_01105 [Methanocorpusculum sp. MG]|uniref:Lipoprotein n=1 Tax=Methanocorpusculum petauri TaxID=3002863 RepID=A0ABT4IDK8_9EURY|nr:hypothetical protein [Methanocorpusculum petauri]MCZ0859822.1 hypothetical protein [Methanocorpusculum petauri]MDE2443903.1 hypothetical protein [Methanocorpusculum sp.]
MSSRVFLCFSAFLLILVVLFSAGCVMPPDDASDSPVYLWNLGVVSSITIPSGESVSLSPSSLVIEVAEESRLLSGTVSGRQAAGMVFDKDQTLFEMDLSSTGSRRLLMGSFSGNESCVIDLSYEKGSRAISAVHLVTPGSVEKTCPLLTGTWNSTSARQIGLTGEESLRGTSLSISNQTGPLFSGSLDLDIAGTITPHAFVGGIYAVSGSTASGFVIMEDGEFWDVEIAEDTVSFWTTGVSESDTGDEIVSAIREYGRVADTAPDLSGFWSAPGEKTVSGTGLRTVVSGPLTIAVNRTSGKLFAGAGLGGKIENSGSVVFGTRIDDDVYLYRGWIEEKSIHATRLYTENGVKYAAAAVYTQDSPAV